MAGVKRQTPNVSGKLKELLRAGCQELGTSPSKEQQLAELIRGPSGGASSMGVQ